MSRPAKGMRYEVVRKKLQRLGQDPALRESLINQARIYEGEGVIQELADELTHHHSCYSGSSNKQLGYGMSKKFTDEEMIRDGWVKTGLGRWTKK
jgi:hypothetical protein